MIKVAVTGNMGSGKSTVCDIFKKYFAIPIYSCDDESKRLLREDNNVQNWVRKILGNDVYAFNESGKVECNFSKISEIIFFDKSKKKDFEKLMKNFIKDDFEDFCKRNNEAPYVVIESAILFETKSENMVDFIIGIYVEEEQRLLRCLMRDKDRFTINDILSRFHAQQSFFDKQYDFIIHNDGSDSKFLFTLDQQVVFIHDTLMKINRTIKQ